MLALGISEVSEIQKQEEQEPPPTIEEIEIKQKDEKKDEKIKNEQKLRR
jgi:hypothetical protein